MNRLLSRDWLPKQAKWRYRVRLGKKKVAHSVSVHKHYKKERSQYPAILDLMLGE